MQAAIRAGFCYFLLLFGAGFVFGVIRELFILPMLGPDLARLVELPVMLILAWYVCRWLNLLIPVSTDASNRIIMGGCMLGLLMVAEATVGVLLMKMSLISQTRAMTTMIGLTGLMAQLSTAAFPYIQARQDLKP